MSFFVKIIYYALFSLSSLGGLFYIVVALFDTRSASQPRERIVLVIASVVALSLLYQAFRLGHQQQQWGAGLGMVIAAIAAFLLVMLIGLFTGKIHWQ
jgi:hypothetical protein